MVSSPTIEWRASTTPFATLSSVPFTGTGFNGAILVGTSSALQTIRIYNNFLGVGGIVDATNCTIASYDDTIHQGTAITPQCTGFYLQVQVLNYNGVITGADLSPFSIGGSTKHVIPINSGIIGGATSNYVTVALQLNIPQNATQGTVSQGVWLEYSSSV